MELPSLSHAGPIISRVYWEQIDALRQHIPGSSLQVQSDIALGVALGAVRAVWAHDPTSEAGCDAGELLRRFPATVPTKDFAQWASQQLPDLTGSGIFSPLGSASHFLWEGMRLRRALSLGGLYENDDRDVFGGDSCSVGAGQHEL